MPFNLVLPDGVSERESHREASKRVLHISCEKCAGEK